MDGRRGGERDDSRRKGTWFRRPLQFFADDRHPCVAIVAVAFRRRGGKFVKCLHVAARDGRGRRFDNVGDGPDVELGFVHDEIRTPIAQNVDTAAGVDARFVLDKRDLDLHTAFLQTATGKREVAGHACRLAHTRLDGDLVQRGARRRLRLRHFRVAGQHFARLIDARKRGCGHAVVDAIAIVVRIDARTATRWSAARVGGICDAIDQQQSAENEKSSAEHKTSPDQVVFNSVVIQVCVYLGFVNMQISLAGTRAAPVQWAYPAGPYCWRLRWGNNLTSTTLCRRIPFGWTTPATVTWHRSIANSPSGVSDVASTAN